MRRRTFLLSLAAASLIGAGSTAGEAGHPGIFPLLRPGPPVASMPDRAHPSGPVRPGHRPFGSVHGGLETGIGYGYPTLYPVGGGSPFLFVPAGQGHGLRAWLRHRDRGR